MTVTDEMLTAYVDGELPEAQRLLVDSAVAADPALFERLEQHRRLRARVFGAFAGVIDEPVPERLVAAGAPSNVVSLRRGPPVWAAIAASLVVGVFAGLSLPKLSERPMIGSDLTAHGELAEALDKQLASAPTDSAVRVGLSFRSQGGYCRTFSEASVAGLACREGDGWRVRMAVAQDGGASSDYRMAGSETPPQVLEAAQALMVGEPLGAAAEAAAQAKGWR